MQASKMTMAGLALAGGMLVVAGTSPVAAQCEVQKLTAADGAASDVFGFSVAVSGDTAVIGAWGDDDLGFDNGAAYVFEKVGGVWTQAAKLTASDGGMNNQFGASVAVSGDTAVIGAWRDDHLGTESGSAYVFEEVGGVWTQMAKLTIADGSAGDRFGFSVAVSGDTVVIGAPGDRWGGGPGAESAYVFEKVRGVWTQTARLRCVGGVPSSCGRAVALSGDTAVIARYRWANVFERVAGIWSRTATLTAADGWGVTSSASPSP